MKFSFNELIDAIVNVTAIKVSQIRTIINVKNIGT